ncbi:RiPP maturation radical SAM C-methyltransferase [bacterium]|nr:RiPP maturation radical SAM C-methyltransferase [bacterium]
MSILLVHMPFAAVERPSIGLGTLQACLEREGLVAEVIYANLLFAERIGLKRYKLVEFTPTDVFLGEWAFAAAAFPDFHPDMDAYFREADLDVMEAIFGPRQNLRPLFEDLRRETPAFIDELVESLLAKKPRIVGASSTFQQHCASLALLRRLKQARPDLITVLGGANCEGAMGQATHREFPWVDYVVSGEADELAGQLFRTLLEDPQRPLPVSVLTPAQRGQAPGRSTVEQLDQVPAPNYDDYFALLDSLEVGKRIEPGLLVESSRGCWWGARHHCTFCGLNGTGMGYRSKSAERALGDFTQLQERYGSNRFEVVDNILDMRYFQTVLPQLEERNLNIFYETKANLKREHVAQLARSGVRWIQPGIESMHDEILRHIEKGSTALTNVQLLKWTREFGVRVSWNFLSGFPGEKDEWYAEMASWLPWISHLQPPQEQSPNPHWTWRVTQIRYERFSPYHVRPADFGLRLSPNRYYSYVYPLEEESLAELAYFFEDREALQYPRTGDRPDEHSRPGRQALERWVDHWIRIFWQGLPLILSMSDQDGKLLIIDTRPCALQRFVTLEGAERELYLACDSPQTAASAGSPEILRRLVDRKLMLHLNGRYLSLAVRGELPAMPRNWEFPGGCMDVEPGFVSKRLAISRK